MLDSTHHGRSGDRPDAEAGSNYGGLAPDIRLSLEASRDHRDPYFGYHCLVVDRAENNLGVVTRGLLYNTSDRRHFVNR